MTIEHIHAYLRRAAARPFAPELMQPLCIAAGIVLTVLVFVAGRA